MKTKHVYVTSDQVPSVDDVMALIHKLPYLELVSFKNLLIGTEANEIAETAELYVTRYDQFEKAKNEPALAHPPVAPPMPAPWGGR